jgi:hypothetical protein
MEHDFNSCASGARCGSVSYVTAHKFDAQTLKFAIFAAHEAPDIVAASQ